MTTKQLADILYETYEMDAWFPPAIGRYRSDFRKQSYIIWAISELKNYISSQIYPRTEGNIEEFEGLTKKFAMKMSHYAYRNPGTREIFATAMNTAMDVWDLLAAMENTRK